MASSIRNYFTGNLEAVFLSIDENIEDERDTYFQEMMARDEKDDVGCLYKCDQCAKVYKTHRGLSRHQTAKHSDVGGIISSSSSKFSPVVIKELSERSAVKVSKEDYYPEKITMEFKCFSMDTSRAEKICII